MPPAYLSMNRFARSALNQRSGNYVCNCPIVNQCDGCTTITNLNFEDFADETDTATEWVFNQDLEVKECERFIIKKKVL